MLQNHLGRGKIVKYVPKNAENCCMVKQLAFSTGSMGFVFQSQRGDSYFIVQRLDWINGFCVWIPEGWFLLHCTAAWLDQWVLCLNPGGEILTSLYRGLTGSVGFVCESWKVDSYFYCTEAWLDQWVLCLNPGGEILTSLYRGLTGSMGFVFESRRGGSYFIVQRLDWINLFLCVNPGR